ncbi:MAG TPA: FecR domain-containing protein [Verrucomicrobiae bacterium]|nr:FecR domain-containing protein [Verrucomicrobiae bacterium]
MSKRTSISLLSLALGALLLAPSLAHAAAGNVLFTLGRVEIQRDGQMLPAQRGSAVEVGDTISTGPTGVTQLRMRDGSLMALKSGTVMTVEDFQLPVTRAPAVPSLARSPAPAPAAVASNDTARSVFRLARGAFRTVTGLIGKAIGDDYRVITPAATIGIRGTDYTAAYCSGNCKGIADGLYVGVSNGKVIITNDQGQLPLNDNEYAYVKDTGTPPTQETSPPEVLEQSLDGAGDEEGEGEGEAEGEGADAATEGAEAPADENAPAETSGTDTALGTGMGQPEGTYELLPGEPAAVAFSIGPFQGAADYAGATTNGAYLDEQGGLIGFLAGDTQGIAFYSIGTAQNFDGNSDFDTGIRWGRWHGGDINVGGSSVLLTTQSLHWIYALTPDAPVLPTSGSASYRLVGNTDPTDNSGNTGFLGNATLSADFAQQTVTSTLDLGINNTVWQAIGSGSIVSGAPVFAGGYTVNINDAVGAPIGTGSGSFTGFFTDGGAGLSYSLASGGTTVNGAAAFAGGAP